MLLSDLSAIEKFETPISGECFKTIDLFKFSSKLASLSNANKMT